MYRSFFLKCWFSWEVEVLGVVWVGCGFHQYYEYNFNILLNCEFRNIEG